MNIAVSSLRFTESMRILLNCQNMQNIMITLIAQRCHQSKIGIYLIVFLIIVSYILFMIHLILVMYHMTQKMKVTFRSLISAVLGVALLYFCICTNI